ncbi:hypothetical protein [Sphingobium sp. KCTC 72723]|uniref:hypothetical protein n=1 Tax=Sphingobium sp. KCTC 72723 TaxID=2733867 RepID=UPI00165E12DF|nr:hypothetical protein [Sphingobium sp. KCTC 72723]
MNMLSGLVFAVFMLQPASQNVNENYVSASSVETLETEARAGNISLAKGVHRQRDVRVQDVMVADCLVFFETSLESGTLKGVALDLSKDSAVRNVEAGIIEITRSTNASVSLVIHDTSHTKDVIDALDDVKNHCRNGMPIFGPA